ncbi:MFS transporter [Candidatus Nitrosocosmicus franklandus]|uniref:Multidrug resistance protein 3 n=1 Tax=Candidatus Nitrosocosmicus franklandianus TaxID=1798806 RepID=A0A484ID54_9ARCH|nr:MFS transporter [Candidatus Nitrosocosmicus franklandus]VFJ14149.1 Multidrug resistance protein 3 [Candidatus Nitrosocosmicus franklandus]
MVKNRPKKNELINEPTTVSRHAWFTLAILSSTLLTVFFSETMLLPALPDIINEFNISYGTAAWIFSAYLIVAAVMTPVAGRLSDLYGKKKILLIMLGTYIVGLAMGGFADNIVLLLVSRVIQGVGLAAIPAAFSLLRDTFPPAKLSIAVGLFGSAYSAGSVVGLFVGASIIQSFGWHATFLAIVPFTALVTLLIIRFVTESAILEDGSALKDIKHSESNTNRKSLTIDLKGVLSLSATISFFLLALTIIQIGVSINNLQVIVGAFALSAISLSFFITIERRMKNPFVNLKLLKNRILLPSYIILIATGITMFMMYPTIVQLVRSPNPLGFGGSSVDAANVQLPFMISFLVFASITPFIINKIGGLKPIIIGGIVSITGALGLLAFHATEFSVSINLAILASGLSLIMTSSWNLVVSLSPKEYAGISVGVGALLLFIGMAIGPALAGVYMANHETIDGIQGSYPSSNSYNLVFLTAGALSTVTIVFSLLLKRALSLRNA